MYKITHTGSIKRLSDSTIIPPVSDNRDYLQFVDDIYEKGIQIVEGADAETQISYVDARKAEYPPLEEQLDKIYHSGIDAWKTDIKAIKDKYPKTQVGITSIAPIPDWVKTALFDKQKEKYVKAKARLEQHELANGKKGVVGTQKIWDASTNSYIDKDIIEYVIQPLPIWVDGVRNPLIVQDEKERGEAQDVISETPQAVIDSINT